MWYIVLVLIVPNAVLYIYIYTVFISFIFSINLELSVCVCFYDTQNNTCICSGVQIHKWKHMQNGSANVYDRLRVGNAKGHRWNLAELRIKGLLFPLHPSGEEIWSDQMPGFLPRNCQRRHNAPSFSQVSVAAVAAGRQDWRGFRTT